MLYFVCEQSWRQKSFGKPLLSLNVMSRIITMSNQALMETFHFNYIQ